MPSETPPAWLPDGWIMTVKTRENGKVDRYYTSPVSRHEFRSKGDVLRYLNFEKVNGLPPRSSDSDYNKDSARNCQRLEDSDDSFSWLPRGWILEIRTRKTGEKAGSNYKCYFDPSSGSRFYSKTDVFHYLEGGHKSPEKGSITLNGSESLHINDDPNSQDNVLALVECSPDGFPSGWIKELKYRKNSSPKKIDPYYTDPVSGYVFRSKKDVARYLETGHIGRHAFKPRNKKFVNTTHSMEEPFPPIAAGSPTQVGDVARRCLFASPISSSSNKLAELPGEEVSFQNNGHEMPQCEGPGLSLIAVPHTPDNIQAGAPIKFQSDQGYDLDVLAEKPSELDQELITEQVQAHRSYPASMYEKSTDSSNERLLQSVDRNTVELRNENFEVKKVESFHAGSSSDANLKVSGALTKSRKKLAVRKSSRKKIADKEEISELTVEEASLGSSQNRPLETVDVNQTGPLPHELSGIANRQQTVNERLSEPEDIAGQVDKLLLGLTGSSHNNLSEAVDTIPTGLLSDRPSDIADCRTPQPTEKLSEAEYLCELVDKKHAKRAKKLPGETSTKRVTRSSSAISSKYKGRKTSVSPSKPREGKTLSLPRRASKRLAGLEPGPAASIESVDPSSRKSKRLAVPKDSLPITVFDSSRGPDNYKIHQEQNLNSDRETTGEEPIDLSGDGKHHIDLHNEGQKKLESTDNVRTPFELVSDASRKSKGKEPIVRDADPDEEYARALQTDDMKQESSISSPFGDTWLDPCIEFAFKTLTGDIPGFDDVAATEHYFEKLLGSNLSPNAECSAPLSGLQGQSNSLLQRDSMDSVTTVPAKTQQEGSLKRGLQSSENMNRRSNTVKVNN